MQDGSRPSAMIAGRYFRSDCQAFIGSQSLGKCDIELNGSEVDGIRSAIGVIKLHERPNWKEVGDRITVHTEDCEPFDIVVTLVAKGVIRVKAAGLMAWWQ